MFKALALRCFAFSFQALAGLHNFGVVVVNARHMIYRSAALGASGLEELEQALAIRDLPFPTRVVSMNWHGYRRLLPYPSHYAIEEYEASQSGAFEFFHAFGYANRTYLDGRNPSRPRHDIDHAIAITPRYRAVFGFREDNQVDGGMDAFYRILGLVLDAPGPVIFHCTGGRHRTGIIALAIRYIQGGAWLDGRHPVWVALRLRFLNNAQYEYFTHNKLMFRQENLDFVETWAKSPEASAYVSRYRKGLN